jgi:hypothetical protein
MGGAISSPPTLAAIPSSIDDAPKLLGCFKVDPDTLSKNKDEEHYTNDLWDNFLKTSNFGSTNNSDVSPLVGLYGLHKDRSTGFWGVKGARYQSAPLELCGGDACIGGSISEGLHLFLGYAEGVVGTKGYFVDQGCTALYDRRLRNGDSRHVYKGCYLPPSNAFPYTKTAVNWDTNPSNTGGMTYMGLVNTFDACANLTDGVFPYFGLLEAYDAGQPYEILGDTNPLVPSVRGPVTRSMSMMEKVDGFRCYGRTSAPTDLNTAVGCQISDGIHPIGGWVSRNLARLKAFINSYGARLPNTTLEAWYQNNNRPFHFEWYKALDVRFIDNFPRAYVPNVEDFIERAGCPGCPGDTAQPTYMPIAWYQHNPSGLGVIEQLLNTPSN